MLGSCRSLDHLLCIGRFEYWEQVTTLISTAVPVEWLASKMPARDWARSAVQVVGSVREAHSDKRARCKSEGCALAAGGGVPATWVFELSPEKAIHHYFPVNASVAPKNFTDILGGLKYAGDPSSSCFTGSTLLLLTQRIRPTFEVFHRVLVVLESILQRSRLAKCRF